MTPARGARTGTRAALSDFPTRPSVPERGDPAVQRGPVEDTYLLDGLERLAPRFRHEDCEHDDGGEGQAAEEEVGSE